MVIDKKLIIAIVSVVVVIILLLVFMGTQTPSSSENTGGGSNSGGGTGSEMTLTRYSASAGENGPVLSLSFSKPLSLGYSIKLMTGDFKTAGVWVDQSSVPTYSVDMYHIAPPNLIGTYYVVVYSDSGTELNTTITFSQPELRVVNYKVNEVVKGTSAYLENITLNISETGDSPYYYTKLTWNLDGNSTVEKLPLEHFTPGSVSTVTIYINKLTDVGQQHTLTVELGYYDMTQLKITLNFQT